jgi:hypothetical protein
MSRLLGVGFFDFTFGLSRALTELAFGCLAQRMVEDVIDLEASKTETGRSIRRRIA